MSDLKIKIDLGQMSFDAPPKKSKSRPKQAQQKPSEAEGSAQKNTKKRSKPSTSAVSSTKNPINKLVESTIEKDENSIKKEDLQDESFNMNHEKENSVNLNNNSGFNQGTYNVSLSFSNNNNKELIRAAPIPYKKLKHWERRWVLIQNVFDFTKEIWLKRWVLVDDCEDNEDENVVENYYEDKRPKEALSKKYQCSFEECSKIFVDSSSLKKHMLTHGERQYICKEEGCGKKFLDNSKLRRHQLVHTGEKPFKCDLCGKKFSLDFNLKTHLRTHTGEKPYFCSYAGCDKRFTQSSNLTAHEKTHKEAETTRRLPLFSTKVEETNHNFVQDNLILKEEVL